MLVVADCSREWMSFDQEWWCMVTSAIMWLFLGRSTSRADMKEFTYL